MIGNLVNNFLKKINNIIDDSGVESNSIIKGTFLKIEKKKQRINGMNLGMFCSTGVLCNNHLLELLIG